MSMLQFVKPLLDRAGVETNVGFANLAETSNLFHMSWAKNTSHQMAINHLASHPLPASTSVSGLPSDIGGVVYVNLDADNSIGPKFIETLVAAFISRRTAAVHCRGFEDGTCGRLAVRANTFQQLGGYDQEPDVLPSGYQDIDLKLRIGRYFNKPVSLLAVQNKKEPAMHEVIGYAAPNAEDKKADRGSAKIAKVSNPNHQTWGQMNAVNSQTMSRKAARGPVRNNDRLGYGLGWPCRVVTLEELPIGKDVAAGAAAVGGLPPAAAPSSKGAGKTAQAAVPPRPAPATLAKTAPATKGGFSPPPRRATAAPVLEAPASRSKTAAPKSKPIWHVTLIRQPPAAGRPLVLLFSWGRDVYEKFMKDNMDDPAMAPARTGEGGRKPDWMVLASHWADVMKLPKTRHAFSWDVTFLHDPQEDFRKKAHHRGAYGNHLGTNPQMQRGFTRYPKWAEFLHHVVSALNQGANGESVSLFFM